MHARWQALTSRRVLAAVRSCILQIVNWLKPTYTKYLHRWEGSVPPIHTRFNTPFWRAWTNHCMLGERCQDAVEFESCLQTLQSRRGECSSARSISHAPLPWNFLRSVDVKGCSFHLYWRASLPYGVTLSICNSLFRYCIAWWPVLSPSQLSYPSNPFYAGDSVSFASCGHGVGSIMYGYFGTGTGTDTMVHARREDWIDWNICVSFCYWFCHSMIAHHTIIRLTFPATCILLIPCEQGMSLASLRWI